jgi:Tfp pilus assembly protein PilF
MSPCGSFPNSAQRGTRVAWCSGGLAASMMPRSLSNGPSSTARRGPRSTIRSLRACAAFATTPRPFRIVPLRFSGKATSSRRSRSTKPRSSRIRSGCARVNLIALYGGKRQWNKAEQHFQALVDLGLRVAEGHYNFAVCLATQGETTKAADQFRTALEINPQYAPAWVGLAQLAERAGRLDEAETAYRKAAEQAPDDAATQFNLARMMLARRDSQQAIAVLERIVTRDNPDRARYLFALATAHVQAGDLAGARRYAVEARDLARSRGQTDLATAIERDLARLP